MSGHSKWSTIKRKKGAADAKRGKIFTRLLREVTIASRLGGGDPDANPRLRAAIAECKANNMPKDNLERAIKKGTGELEGESYEEITYEAYAPGGVAFLIEAMTDNTNRTTPEIRFLLDKNGGSLGTPGSASYLFERKGFFSIPRKGVGEEKLMETVIEAGAEEIETDDPDSWSVYTGVDAFEKVRQALETASIRTDEAKLGMFPSAWIAVADEEVEKVLNLMEVLDDHDDVQNIWTNFDVPEDALASSE